MNQHVLTSLKTIVFAICALSLSDVCALAEESPSDYLPAIAIVHAIQGPKISSGAGFFISSEGDLVTAYHNVAGADRIVVVAGDITFEDIGIKAYDNTKDLIVLEVNGASSLPFHHLKVGSHPEHLSGKSGLAIGHPDLKEEFAIRVTFPQDKLYPATQWSVGPSSPVGRRGFIFNSSDLNLLVLDGTINEGMSGGPVIVDNHVIGVISGSEERTGAGLG